MHDKNATYYLQHDSMWLTRVVICLSMLYCIIHCALSTACSIGKV